MIVEIVNPQGTVSYTRPHDHPDVLEAFRTPGYSVRGSEPAKPCSRAAGGWTVAKKRLEARRDYWDSCKEDALRDGNLCNAAGFQCRAVGLTDALAILAVVEGEDSRSNDQALPR